MFCTAAESQGVFRMKPTVRLAVAVTMVALGWQCRCLGQTPAPITITFDGPPYYPPNYDVDTHFYSEYGFAFSGDFGHAYTNTTSSRPSNGSSYIEDGIGFHFNQNGDPFGVISVDLAAFSVASSNMAITFVGDKSDGSTITTNFAGTGIAFQTCHFGPEWADSVTNVETTVDHTAWSMDNLVVVTAKRFPNPVQNPVTVTFDGPPYAPANNVDATYSYGEGGFVFAGNFTRQHTNTTSSWPQDGSSYVQQGTGFSFNQSGNSIGQNNPFGLISVDLAGYSASDPEMAITFVGQRSDGSTITTNFSGSEIAFQTYYFGPEWAYGLTNVEIGGSSWAMDNLVMATAPLPPMSPPPVWPVNISFDGPPYDPPNYGVETHSYNESGVFFSGDFERAYTNTTSLQPNDGSSYLREGIGFGFNMGGNLFGLASVDLAAYSYLATNMSITFVGYRADGSTVTTNFASTGLVFQTYYFGPEWFYGMTNVAIGDVSWSMDNLVVLAEAPPPPPPFYDQSPVTITFDGPPYYPPNSGIATQFYNEGGVNFSGGFGRMFTNTMSTRPIDGSTYIQDGGIHFGFDRGGNLFGLGAVDLAAYSSVVTNMAITFIGHRADGSTITTNFSGTGMAFQTYYFGPDWAYWLTSVSISNSDWSMDNLVVLTEPPPIVPDPDFDYVITNASIVITRYKGTNGDVVVPNTIRNEPVIEIGSGAFDWGGVTNVILPGTVRRIGVYAFGGCWQMSSVAGLSNCVSLGDQAFYGCISLTNITLPDSVTNIGRGAFEYCNSLTSFTVPAGVSFLQDSTFEVCRNLRVVYLHEGVGAISNAAFANCVGLTNIHLPESLTNIGDDAFYYCTSLPGIKFPTNLESLGDRAFEICTRIGNVSLPASVTNIGTAAFAGCSSVGSFSVDGRNPSYRGDSGVLFSKDKTVLMQYPCAGLRDYEIPDTVKSVGDYAFYACGELLHVTIPPGVTNLGAWAFDSCLGLTNVAIPAGVTSIGDVAFRNCKALQAISVDEANPAYSSLDGVLFDKNKTVLIQYPGGKAGSYRVPSSVRTIGDWAFSDCAGLTKITLPGSVTTLLDDAFLDCPNLTSVFCQGNVPAGAYNLPAANQATVYYEPGRGGWGNLSSGLSLVLWNPRIRGDAGLGVRTNGFGFNIVGASNLRVVVEASTRSAGGEWSPVGTNVLAGGVGSFNDPEWTNYPARFYRLTPP